jgi:hypothetical protein
VQVDFIEKLFKNIRFEIDSCNSFIAQGQAFFADPWAFSFDNRQQADQYQANNGRTKFQHALIIGYDLLNQPFSQAI